MEITELPAEDLDRRPGLVDELVDLQNAGHAVDAPWVHPTTPTTVRGFFHYGWDLEPGRHFVGRSDGRLAALGAVHTSDWDNLDLAWLEVTVHPELRSRGLGSLMADHMCAVAASMGRTKLGADAWDGTAGVGFAERHGFTQRSRAINRRQHLAELSLDRVQQLYGEAEAVAAAYELVRIVGRTPDDLMPAVADLAASINDAPLDELDIEDEVFPPERIRNYETATLGRGHRLYRLLARHRETGALAGHTVVAVEVERPAIGHQHDTSVAREHRGHRLGLLLKTAMNLWLAEAEPRLETVDTWNTESNDHMIGVNEALGYRWMGRGIELQQAGS